MPPAPARATSGEEYVERFFPGTAATYDRIAGWTSLGFDGRWKKALLEMLPPSRSILELACGTGILTQRLLERFPEARLVGVDITAEYLAIAKTRLEGRGRDVRFVLSDAVEARVEPQGPFDLVVSCYLPKYVDPDRLLARVTPSLAPGATLALQDFDAPRGLLPRMAWRAWFGFLDLYVPSRHPEWKNVFDTSLVTLIRTSEWPRRYKAALARHGYVDVRSVRHTGSTARTVLARRP